MKQLLRFASLFLFLTTFLSLNAQAPRLQVVHNAADPDIGPVDLYVDGSLAVAGLAFREATPFADLPVGWLTLEVRRAGDPASAPPLVARTLHAEAGVAAAALLCGVVDPASCAPNPEGLSTGLSLMVRDGLRETATNPAAVEMLPFHGATDAPALDWVRSDGTELATGLLYSHASSYRPLPPESAALDMVHAAYPDAVQATFPIDLTARAGQSGILFMSGFADPPPGGEDAELTLCAAFADGSVMRFGGEFFDWHLYCATDQRVDLTGTGTDGADTVYLDIPDPGSATYLVAEVIAKGATASMAVDFWSDVEPPATETGMLLPPLAAGTHTVRAFRRWMLPASTVRIAADDPSTALSLVVYVFRSASPDSVEASKGLYQQFYLFKGSHSIQFTGNPVPWHRDLRLQIPITDLQDDVRQAVITASAGPVSETVTVTHSDLGDYLRIVEMTLDSVPGSVDVIHIDFDSPVPSPAGAGDSYVFGAVASYVCAPAPLSPASLDFSPAGAHKGFAHWNPVWGAKSYRICGRAVDDPSTTSCHDRSDPYRRWLHLEAGREYAFRVRAESHDGQLSDYSDWHHFVFGETTGRPAGGTGLAVIPNPATNSTVLQVGDAGSASRLEVHDPTGRLVLSRELSASGPQDISLDLHGWPAGIYPVRVLRPGSVEIHRLAVVR